MRWNGDTYKKYKEEMEKPKQIIKVKENEDVAIPEVKDSEVENTITDGQPDQTEIKE